MSVKDFSDGELLHELKQRGRVRTLVVSRMWYNEMIDAEHYIDDMMAWLGKLLGKKLIEDKIATVTDRPGAMPGNNSAVTNRDVELTVIVPNEVV